MSDKETLPELQDHKGKHITPRKESHAPHMTHDTGPAKLTKLRLFKREQAKRDLDVYLHSMKNKQRLSSAWAIDLSSDEEENVMELYKQALLDDHKTKLTETYPKEYSKIYTYEMEFGDDDYDIHQESPASSPSQGSKFKKKKKKTKGSPDTVKKQTTFSDSKSSHSSPVPPDNSTATDAENEAEKEPQDETGQADNYSSPTENQSSLNLASTKSTPISSPVLYQPEEEEEEETNGAPEDVPQELDNDSQENVCPGERRTPDHDDSGSVLDDRKAMCQDWDDCSSEPKDTGYDKCDGSYEAVCCCREHSEPMLWKEECGLVYHPPKDEMSYGKLSCTYCTDVERDYSRYNDTYPYNDNLPYNNTHTYNDTPPYNNTHNYHDNLPYNKTHSYNDNLPYNKTHSYNDNLPCNKTHSYNDNLPCNKTHSYNANLPYSDTRHYSCCNENKLVWNDQYCEPPKLPDFRNKSTTYLGRAESEIPSVSLYSKPMTSNLHTYQHHRNGSPENTYETRGRLNDRLSDINSHSDLLLDCQRVRRGDLFSEQTNNSTSVFSLSCDLPYKLKNNLTGAWRQNKRRYDCLGCQVPCSYAPKKVVEPIEESFPDTHYSNKLSEQPSNQNRPEEYPTDVLYLSCENKSNGNPPPPMNQPYGYRQDETFLSYKIKSNQYNPDTIYSTHNNPTSDCHQEKEYSCQPYSLNPDNTVTPPYEHRPTSNAVTERGKNVFFQQETDYHQENKQNLQIEFHTRQAKLEPVPDLDLYSKDSCFLSQRESQSFQNGCSCQQAEETGNHVLDALPTVLNKCEVWQLDGCKTWTYGTTDTVGSSKDNHHIQRSNLSQHSNHSQHSKHSQHSNHSQHSQHSKHSLHSNHSQHSQHSNHSQHINHSQHSQHSNHSQKEAKSSHRSGEIPVERKSSKIFKFSVDARMKTVTCCLVLDNEQRADC